MDLFLIWGHLRFIYFSFSLKAFGEFFFFDLLMYLIGLFGSFYVEVEEIYYGCRRFRRICWLLFSPFSNLNSSYVCMMLYYRDVAPNEADFDGWIYPGEVIL